MKFIDRINEIETLEGNYKDRNSAFLVIYGRRRIGKSELIKHFMRGKNGIYMLAREEPKSMQLAYFSSLMAQFFHDKVLEKSPLLN